MDKIKQVKVIGNVIGFNMYDSKKETYNVQFPDMTIAELESYQFEEADAYHTNDRPRYLRNVLARLRELPEHDRKVWMDGIMHEFANDYGSVKYTLGYEQGKFDGAVEAEKSNKVVIPQFVADCIIARKGVGDTLIQAMEFYDELNNIKEYDWISDNSELFARAWLDGYDVEQEKRYFVKIRATKHCFAKDGNGKIFFSLAYKGCFTKKELEDADFGWVFDCEGVEVQEVEE